MTDNDVSASTDGTNNDILSILSLTLDFFKSSAVKSVRISTGKNGENMCLEITEGNYST